MKRFITAAGLAFICHLSIASAQTARARIFDPLWDQLNETRSVSNFEPGWGNNRFYRLSKAFLRTHDESDFKRMTHDRNPIVRAMGLLCLAQTDAEKYRFMIQAHATDKDQIAFFQGCLSWQITLGEFTRQLLDNPYFLEPGGKRPEKERNLSRFAMVGSRRSGFVLITHSSIREPPSKC